MPFVAEPISDLRPKRFHRWAMLWLKWFVRFLDEAGVLAPIPKQGETIGHRWLDCIERIIVSIVMMRAAPHVRRVNSRKGVSQHRRNDTALRRAVIGSNLRRALRPKNLRQRVEALTLSIDALVARRVAPPPARSHTPPAHPRGARRVRRRSAECSPRVDARRRHVVTAQVRAISPSRGGSGIATLAP